MIAQKVTKMVSTKRFDAQKGTNASDEEGRRVSRRERGHKHGVVRISFRGSPFSGPVKYSVM